MALSIDYSDKTVVVIGGTSGINLGIAETFAAHGAKLAVASRSEKKVNSAIEQLQKFEKTVIGTACDVRDVDSLRRVLKGFHDAFGPFDVLVSGAAGKFPATAVGMSPNAFRSVIDIDLIGSYHVAREGFIHIRKPGGTLINISAPQAFLPAALQAHVCAAKAGVDMLTRVLAMEWGPSGVRVNSIVPGPIAGTEGMARLAPTPELKASVRNSVPLRREGTPGDIANAALFLGSPLASYLTGIVMPVDGGWSLGGFGIIMTELQRTIESSDQAKS
jgi:NAD(P)-dependent dehydrogenase (short-subunit alcohol dehydrogenase family)